MASSSKPIKRRIKDPESFRQKALKAQQQKDKPKRQLAKNNLMARSFKTFFRPFKAAILKLRSIKLLRPLFIFFGFIGRIIFPRYLRSSFEELRTVSWPSFKESRKLTYAVLVFAIVFGASVAIVDWGLGKLFKHILLK